MRSLVLRIYIVLVAVLLLFAGVSGWLVNRHFEAERQAVREALSERAAAWSDLARQVLPAPDAPDAQQADGVETLSKALRLPLALEGDAGQRRATSASFARRERDADDRAADADDPRRMERFRARVVTRLDLGDGRTLLLWRPGWRGAPPHAEPGRAPPMMPPGIGLFRATGPDGPPIGAAGGLLLLLALLFVAVAAAAWPVARRLTRRLEALQRGVETFGDGALGHRVPVEGRDEVSALARSFNRAAERVESLVTANRQLLANASHELRSPLARLKMAVSLLEAPDPAGVAGDEAAGGARRRERLQLEVHANIAELDAMVEEVLLASRLDAAAVEASASDVRLDLRALAREEANLARIEASRTAQPRWTLTGPDAQPSADRTPDPAPSSMGVSSPAWVVGDERLLRRALRNLLQNARRYGGAEAQLSLSLESGMWVLAVADRGVGVELPWRERIFEPFFRLPGHSESSGGVGLGLSLVRQIALRHRGDVRCEGRSAGDGPGSVFRLTLPAV